jgi:hypothetical protein
MIGIGSAAAPADGARLVPMAAFGGGVTVVERGKEFRSCRPS